MQSGSKKTHDLRAGKAEEAAIAEGLAAIYGEERDDLSTLERAPSPLTRWLVRTVIALAITVVVSYLGYFAVTRVFTPPSGDPLALTFDVPSTIVSGTTHTLTLQYANEGRVPLAALSVDLNVPEAFRVSAMTPEPTDAEELVWNIGSIAAKSDGTIVLEGVWIADVPSATTVQALATYRPANFNAEFDEVASAGVTTLASVLTVTGEGPEGVRPGESADYVFTIENTGDLTMSGVALALALPEGFYLTTSTPALAAGASPTWFIGDLAAQATAQVTLTGAFTADVEDIQSLQAAVTVSDGHYEETQAETQLFTDVEGNGLRLQLVANGTSGDVSLDPGDPLRITIGYENTGETPIEDLSLLLDFQAEGKVPIPWSEATLDGGRLTAEGILWSSAGLGTLGAAEEGIRNAIFPLKEALAEGEVQSFTVVVHATVDGVTIQSQPLTITLNSDTAFTAQARYYTDDGAPLGEGPLPPAVGEETTFILVWTVTNTLHALSDVRVSATLPTGVTWEDDVATDYGTVTFDETTRTVVWSSTNLPEDAAEVTATMRVSLTPNEDDVGAFVKLLSGSAFRATDALTGASMQLTADALTTALDGDEHATNKGAVVE